MVGRMVVVALCLLLSACFEIDASSEVHDDGSVTSHTEIAVLPIYLDELQKFARNVRSKGIDVAVTTRADGYFVASWDQDGMPLSNDWSCSNRLLWTQCKFRFFRDFSDDLAKLPPQFVTEMSDYVPKLAFRLYLPEGATVIESNAGTITDTLGIPTLIWEQQADQGPFDLHFEVRL